MKGIPKELIDEVKHLRKTNIPRCMKCKKDFIKIEEESALNVASPTYVGIISMLRQDMCGFISNHNVPGFENKNIYFSFKVLMNENVLQGDKVHFNLGTSIDKIWAYNVEKIE